MSKNEDSSLNASELMLALLELLTECRGFFVSYSEIMRVTKTGRKELKKAIENLRSAGFGLKEGNNAVSIASFPDRLDEDRIRHLLKPAGAFCNVKLYEMLDSTNSVAVKEAENGAEEGTLIIADRQSKGRGRKGSSWFSPPGVNCYFSVILRPKIGFVAATFVPVLAAVAAATAIESTTGVKTTIKWPNDILIKGKKVCGILTEARSLGKMVDFMVIGIGINANMPYSMIPGYLRKTATSLRIETGGIVRRDILISRVIIELEKLYRRFIAEGAESVIEMWSRLSGMTGKIVRVFDRELDTEVTGFVKGIDKDGSLILFDKDARLIKVRGGDIILEAK